jgi:hypothetical protein
MGTIRQVTPAVRLLFACVVGWSCACMDGAQSLCAGSPCADAPPSCPGAVPALNTCFVGSFFADCSGSGQQTLACSEADHACRWFSSRCVPLDYQISTCDGAHICCDNDWPYPTMAGPFYNILYRSLYGLDQLPWDRDRALTADLVIDTNVIVQSSQATCVGVDPFPAGTTPCNAPSWTSSHNYLRVYDTIALEIGSMRGVAGWFPAIELDPARGRARACAFRITDAYFGGCKDHQVLCATSGTIRMNRLPTGDEDRAGLMGSVDLRFVDDFTLHVEFVY